MKYFFAFAIALSALHGANSFAEESGAPATTPAINAEKPEADTTLFTRVNGAYRKSEKQLKRES
ncbi:MAG: hypothetical protein EOP11_16185 [Proteobacteria bacterium]|nr:MAG: hypothetical protein EOP11_16185 [Pseudomonadota bacterium]